MRRAILIVLLLLAASVLAADDTRTFANNREGWIITIPRDWDRDASFRLGTIFLSRDGLANVEIMTDELREGQSIEQFVAYTESLRTFVDVSDPSERHLSGEDCGRYNCDAGMLGTYNVGPVDDQTLMVRLYLAKGRRVYMLTTIVLASRLSEYRAAVGIITGSFRITAE